MVILHLQEIFTLLSSNIVAPARLITYSVDEVFLHTIIWYLAIELDTKSTRNIT